MSGLLGAMIAPICGFLFLTACGAVGASYQEGRGWRSLKAHEWQDCAVWAGKIIGALFLLGFVSWAISGRLPGAL